MPDRYIKLRHRHLSTLLSLLWQGTVEYMHYFNEETKLTLRVNMFYVFVDVKLYQQTDD